jgi:hypothetical protein
MPAGVCPIGGLPIDQVNARLAVGPGQRGFGVRKFVGLLAVTVLIVLVSSPVKAQAAVGNLSITNIDLPSNTVKVQVITVGDGMGDVTVTVPYDLQPIIFVRRAGGGGCPGGGTVYVCTGDPGEIEVLFEASPLSSGLVDNQALTVTAQSSGVTVSGTVTIRRSTDLYVGSGSFTAVSANTAYLQVFIGNRGPDRASGVQVFVDGVDPRVWVTASSCDRSGARIVCSLVQVPTTTGSMVLVNLTRCAVTSPVTVSVSTTTTELNPGNNSGAVPALSDGSKTCDQFFANLVPGVPPGGGSGGGSGSGAGAASAAGTGSASGTPSDTASGSAGPSESSSTTGSSSDQRSPGPRISATASAAGDRPGNSTPVILLIGVATILLAGSGVAWLRLHRRSTVQTPTPD